MVLFRCWCTATCHPMTPTQTKTRRRQPCGHAAGLAIIVVHRSCGSLCGIPHRAYASVAARSCPRRSAAEPRPSGISLFFTRIAFPGAGRTALLIEAGFVIIVLGLLASAISALRSTCRSAARK
jgi:hypothetical protein